MSPSRRGTLLPMVLGSDQKGDFGGGGGGVVRNGVRHCWAQVYFTDGRSCRVGYRAEIRSSSMRGASQIHLLRWSSPTVRPLRSLVVETPLRLPYRHKDKYTRVCTCAYIMDNCICYSKRMDVNTSDNPRSFSVSKDRPETSVAKKIHVIIIDYN